MQLDLRENGSISILVLSGALTSSGEGQLTEATDTLLAADRTDILLDLSELEYMDSVGIGELVSSYRTITGLGGALKIIRPSSKVRDALSLAKLLPIFEIFDDEESAVASFAG